MTNYYARKVQCLELLGACAREASASNLVLFGTKLPQEERNEDRGTEKPSSTSMRWHREASPASHCHLTARPGAPWHCCEQTQLPATSFVSSLFAPPMASADILNLSVKIFQGKCSENCFTEKKRETISSKYCSVMRPDLAHTWTPTPVPQAVHARFITLLSAEAEWLLSALLLAVPRLGLVLSGF